MARAKVELKSEIIDGLERMPMTTHGVSRYVNCHYSTAENRLEELERDGVVESYIDEDGESSQKWRLKN